MKTWRTELELAVSAASAAADCLRQNYANDAGIQFTGGKDIKTQADHAAEAVTLEILKPTGIPCLAEESAADTTGFQGLHWVVDPLDGTMNFTRSFPMYAVSIALWDGEEPVLGVVYDLANNACYTGIVGESAFMRTGLHIESSYLQDAGGTGFSSDQVLKKTIAVSSTTQRAQAILATGFPSGRDYRNAALQTFLEQVQGFKKIRMIGSASLSLAMVASGVFDAYCEEDIMFWDVAAGLALVAAAGGSCEIQPGRSRHAVTVKATNGKFSL